MRNEADYDPDDLRKLLAPHVFANTTPFTKRNATPATALRSI